MNISKDSPSHWNQGNAHYITTKYIFNPIILVVIERNNNYYCYENNGKYIHMYVKCYFLKTNWNYIKIKNTLFLSAILL